MPADCGMHGGASLIDQTDNPPKESILEFID